MFYIYPFHKFQKQICYKENMHLWLKNNSYIIHDQYLNYYELYGMEAVWLAIVFKPNCVISQNDCYSNWKMLNRIWTLFNINNTNHCNLFESYILKAKNYYDSNRLHLYVNMIYHIVKHCKTGINTHQKLQLYELLKPVFPYLYHNRN